MFFQFDRSGGFYMKIKRLHLFFSLVIILGLCASCRTRPDPDEVVYETYFHRYGVPLEVEDWLARGQDGLVTAMRKDGVTVTKSVQGGILDGDCLYTFPHREVIQKKETYHQGDLIQELLYYPEGFPQQQVDYVSDHHRLMKTWYESGAPQFIEEYEQEKLMTGEYYDLDNRLESNITEAKGLRTCRDGQGLLLWVDTVDQGLVTQRSTYHPSGTPAARSPYVNGQIEGLRRTFLPDGEPASIEEWSQGVQHGNTVVFEYGEKWADVPYVKGIKHGIEHRYRNGEVLIQDIQWVNGRRHGPTYTYIGESPQIEWYFKDRPVVNKATYDMLCNQ
jgi:antitoxin component YwqK of YwqJK toxin-antitoxin module